jgi:prepilin-type N-terminal cleavage/methylation domain-containing protein
MTRIFKNEKGMTLIELLVAISLSAIVGLFLVKIFEVNSQVMTGEQKVMLMNSNARQGIHAVAKNIRLLGFDPSMAGPDVFGITAADGTSITFTADLNNDGTVGANETFGFSQISATADCPTSCIQGLTSGGTRIIARDIMASPAPNINPAFCLQYTYVDGTQSDADCATVNNLPVVSADSSIALATVNLRKISITITAVLEDLHNLTKVLQYETVTSTIMLRNNLPIL